MRDEFDGRFWAENHNQVTAAFGRLLNAIMQAFRVLNHIEYAAPWQVIGARRTTK
jgi:hypothetical protein